MQVFRTYFKILKKNMVPILIYSVLFLWLTIMIASNINVENTEFIAAKTDVMIINEDGDNELVKGFLSYLSQYANYIEAEEDEEARKDALFYRKVDYILTIPEGFTQSLLTGGDVQLIKESIPNLVEAMYIDNAINNYMNTAQVYIKHTSDVNAAELNNAITDTLQQEAQVTIKIKSKDSVTFSNGFNQNYFNYLGYILISTLITGVSLVMFSFHGLDLRRRHSAAPITNHSMNVQLILANLIFVLGFLLMFIIAGFVLNKDRMINENTLLTWLNAIVYTIAALSISYLVGITVKSKRAVNAVATTLSLCLAFLSGIFAPQDYLGPAITKIASFMPTFWYVKANNTIVTLDSFGWSDISGVMGYIAIQLGFAVAFFCIALVVSKRKRLQAS